MFGTLNVGQGRLVQSANLPTAKALSTLSMGKPSPSIAYGETDSLRNLKREEFGSRFERNVLLLEVAHECRATQAGARHCVPSIPASSWGGNIRRNSRSRLISNGQAHARTPRQNISNDECRAACAHMSLG
jgi:hypothetical protein